MKAILLSALLSSQAALASPTSVAFIAGFTGPDPNTARELKRGVDIFLKLEPRASSLVDIKTIDNHGDLESTYRAFETSYKSGIRIFIGVSNSNEAVVGAKFIAEHPDAIFITPFATNDVVI